ncbi:MAG: cyclic nucleotide-binding domain-containing protein [Alphaproteobacteria bacterium]|nr:cyclic nucleotide-binding domain-containing protein [Alphaproteobacteria bacterium]MCB9929690.1 cyclic nucleotide-binding domain-containing protein [Alphaproteobacteria bacterium]
MDVKSLDRIIAAHRFFQGLSPAACALIAGCGRNVHFRPGHRLYRQGDPADTFYVIRHGKVALEMPGAGPATVFQTVGPGDILNASWLVPPYRCTSDARAMETTRAIAFNAVCLRDKCDQDHDLGYELMKRFVPVVIERLSHSRLQAMDLYAAGGIHE